MAKSTDSEPNREQRGPERGREWQRVAESRERQKQQEPPACRHACVLGGRSEGERNELVVGGRQRGRAEAKRQERRAKMDGNGDGWGCAERKSGSLDHTRHSDSYTPHPCNCKVARVCLARAERAERAERVRESESESARDGGVLAVGP